MGFDKESYGKEIKKQCATCEFFMGDICAEGDNKKHKYGDKVTPKDTCDAWTPSFFYFMDLEESNEEYVKNYYDQSKIVRKCGTCSQRSGNACFALNDKTEVRVYDEGCEDWVATSEYVGRLRQIERKERKR